MPTPIRDLNVSQTFNITINLPQQVSGYPVQQVPVSVTQRQNVDIAWVGIAALFAALAVFAAMAWSFYQPFGAIGASAPIVRTSGTVDINQVAIGDQGIDWFNPVSPGVYQLRQNSTGLFVTQNGSTILVNSNGLRVFR